MSGPVYSDPAEFPSCRFLEEQIEVFRDELATIPDDEWEPWFLMGAYSGDWRIFGLHFGGSGHPMLPHLERNLRRRRCPRSRVLLRRVPGLVVAAFSRLGTGAHVLPHADGHERAALRIHLPLRSDASSLLRVAGETRSLEEGRCVCFDLDRVHESFHGGPQPRVVLLLELDLERAHDPLLPADGEGAIAHGA